MTSPSKIVALNIVAFAVLAFFILRVNDPLSSKLAWCAVAGVIATAATVYRLRKLRSAVVSPSD